MYEKIGMDLPKSMYAYNYDEALKAVDEIGFPLMIRASYTLGVLEVAWFTIWTIKELANTALALSPIHEI